MTKKKAKWIAKPERSNLFTMRLAVWVALNLGRRIARFLLYFVCGYFYFFSADAKAASRKYLSKALNRTPKINDYFQHFYTFASTILDRVFLLNDQYSRFDIKVHGLEIVDGMLATGGGCFLLGAHLGSFEIMRALGHETREIKINLVMYEENAKKLNSILAAINPDYFPQIISLGKFDSMLKVKKALDEGEFVGVLGDRTIGEEGDVSCKFLCEDATFPIGPFRLAAMLRRPIVLMFGIYRGGNRYEVYFENLVDMRQLEPGKADVFIKDSLQMYVSRLEHYCRIAPYNWFNFYDFWK